VPLSVGDKLGPYEILAPIGKGGMGEVYRARDPRLNRDVAIKVSAAQFSERFEREAKAIAALNHPNICQIYDVGPNYLVMEYIEGEAPKGPYALEEALRIAAQIGDALEAAHDKGITHRDLKPGNIKVKPDGTVKVLDFGLAKIAATPASTGENSPTLTIGMTEAGMILGTASYMAPEQARGKESVDKRADIWAFGVVLYELITGQRMFTGEDVGEILAKVIRDEPDLSGVPAQVQPLLKRCLEKDPKKRLRDMGDAWALLADAPAASAPSRPRLGWLWPAVTALAIVGALALSLVHFREDPPRLVKLSLLPPEKAAAASLIAVSPDGRHVAFAATLDGKRELWVRDLDSLTARPLPGTEGASDPFWSPDSRSIGFFAPGKLKKIEIAGGPVLTLCDFSGFVRGGAWSQNGIIVFAIQAGLFRISAAGGTAAPLTELNRPSASGFSRSSSPWFLPDGRHFLYNVVQSGPDKDGIYVADIDSKNDAKDAQRIAPANSNALYAPAGYLLFVRERTLMAQPFDASKARTTGDAVPFVEQVDPANRFISSYQFSVSQNGVLAYTAGGGLDGGAIQLSWIDRSGKVVGTAGPPGSYSNFRLAPDEKRIAFDRPDPQSGSQDVWVMDLIRGVTSRLTFDPAVDNLPIWSPDGLRLLYPNNRTGVFDLYVKAATGAGPEELLIKMGTTTGWGTHWSPDGRFILYQTPGVKTGQDLWIAPQFGDRKPFPYLNSQFNESEGSFSPDGRWVAYVSDESGRDEVYVQAFPLSGAKFQISTGGGSEPNWRKDGTELYYLAADRNLMAVPVKSGATLEAGVPKPLFPIAVTAQRHSFAVANDGQRFLVSASAGGEKTVPITVVLNWQAALKR
jgi:serine/threonine protein kinase